LLPEGGSSPMEIQPVSGLQKVIFYILLGVITALFFFIIKPFFFAVFWAVLIAGIFFPVYRFLNKKIKNPNWCAGVTLCLIVLCLLIPLGLLIDLLVVEAFDLYKAFDTNTSSWIASLSEFLNTLNKNPLFARLHIDQAFLIEKSQDALKAVTAYVVNHISAFTQNTILVVVKFAVMLYTLFYFLRDGEHLISAAITNIPLEDKHLRHFVDQFFNTAKASLKFTLIIGGIQGFLGGLIFYITGIEKAVVWGVVMFALSVVPAIGCSLVWAPAGVIMLFLGNIWQGIVILVFGALVISSVDNLLRPVLLGRDTNMHALLIFLSTLGGIAAFGASGFVLGPIIAALFLAAWKLFVEFYQEAKEIKSP